MRTGKWIDTWTNSRGKEGWNLEKSKIRREVKREGIKTWKSSRRIESWYLQNSRKRERGGRTGNELGREDIWEDYRQTGLELEKMWEGFKSWYIENSRTRERERERDCGGETELAVGEIRDRSASWKIRKTKKVRKGVAKNLRGLEVETWKIQDRDRQTDRRTEGERTSLLLLLSLPKAHVPISSISSRFAITIGPW